MEQLWVSNAGRDNPNGGGMRPGDWIVPDKRPMNVLSLLLGTRLSSVRRYPFTNRNDLENLGLIFTTYRRRYESHDQDA